MAAWSCSPGCFLCIREQQAACPFCLGDWACERCWQNFQDVLHHNEPEEWVEHMEQVLDGAGVGPDLDLQEALDQDQHDEWLDQAQGVLYWAAAAPNVMNDEEGSPTVEPDPDDVLDECTEGSSMGSDAGGASGDSGP